MRVVGRRRASIPSPFACFLFFAGSLAKGRTAPGGRSGAGETLPQQQRATAPAMGVRAAAVAAGQGLPPNQRWSTLCTATPIGSGHALQVGCGHLAACEYLAAWAAAGQGTPWLAEGQSVLEACPRACGSKASSVSSRGTSL